MQGEYSAEEVALIVHEADPDGLGLDSIEFSDFIRWWCSSSNSTSSGIIA
jgi:hypothetical protein